MFTRRSRLKRNRRLLETYPIEGNHLTYRHVRHLLQIWRRIKLSDYTSLSTDVLLSSRFESVHQNLIHLNQSCDEQNTFIAEERETQLERGNQHYKERQNVSLDVFLSDKNMVNIDIEKQLRSLVNNLQVLYCTFEQEHLDTSGDYYIRVSDFILRDITNFTLALIEGGYNDVT